MAVLVVRMPGGVRPPTDDTAAMIEVVPLVVELRDGGPCE
jgi:hypothetical protein